ncbi:MAG: SDR family oxidoreductase [Bacteroidales bacterium]|nr:SDR family oxidoreductase [Bacteroidales bacterium]MDD5892685.1 SDR family NAD(P)-dependent oxidoreductase [Bacteroidales bacterium]
MKVKFKGFENYALVTGAASGMGRLYTQRLALMGYNIVAVDINAESLAQTRDIVEKLVGSSLPEYVGNFRFIDIVQDLSTMDAADRIWERTQAEGCVVEVLVNNAGLMFCNGIAETSERKLQMVMMVHMNTPLMLCRKYVNGMKERGCGYILNISSLAAWMDWPAIGMYGNTKRFVKDYSRELRIECQKTGVSVTNAYFGAVDTPLVPLRDDLRKLARGLTVMIRPEKAVDKALSATFRRRKGTMPGFVNWLFWPFIVILPEWLLGWIYRKAKKYLKPV